MARRPLASTTASSTRSRLTWALGDLVELLLELLELLGRHPIHLGVAVHQPVHQRLRGLDVVGLDDLLDERLPHLRVGLAGGLALQVLADGGAERVEPLEVADLAGEGVVEGGQLLALHVVQGDPDPAALAPPRLVRMVVGKLDLGVGLLARAGAS